MLLSTDAEGSHESSTDLASVAATATAIAGADAHLAVVGQHAGGIAQVDVGRLLSTRLLIQAGSGGGKSWLLRRLLEQTHGMVRQIVFDPEGELVTLAERFDYTVCSPESVEAPILPGGGAAAARAIYPSGRSAILSLSEFEPEDMHDFVADFLRELLRMPQDSWHHVVLAFDEAQLFAPQHDKASSKKPLIDLARRGRKRGMCTVCATQRLSELSKGVAGQLENKLIGLTTLDVDIDRAAEVLGLRVPNARTLLRQLPSGNFVAYGPALGYDLDVVKVGPVQTRHGVLNTYAGRPHVASVSHEYLAATLREARGSSGAVAAVEAQISPPTNFSGEGLRDTLVSYADALGTTAVLTEVARVFRELHMPPSDVAPSGGSETMRARAPARKSSARNLMEVRIGSLPPIARAQHLRTVASAVLGGESFEAVAQRFGAQEATVRRWFATALSHVNVERYGVSGQRLDVEKLRQAAGRLMPAIDRALLRSIP